MSARPFPLPLVRTLSSVGLPHARSALAALLASSTLAACEQGQADRGFKPFELAGVETELPPDPVQDHLPKEQTPVGRHGRLRVQGPDLVDKDGNPVQLRGISSMWLNMESSGFAINGTSMKWMRDNWGMTVFRAAMGVSEGNGNDSNGGYLVNPTRMRTLVERIVENATKLGVYVIIDWHDHVAHENGDESEAFFSEMAERYAGNENVLYEVFNEPIPGIRNASNPELNRQFTWEQDIKPYHERLVSVIRARDPQGVIVLGTPFWSQEVDVAAADPVSGTNLMYTLHFYSCTHTEWLRERAQSAREAGLPIFVTEWGASHADGGVSDKTICADESDLWHDWMNVNNISWAAWKLDDCGDTTCLLAPGTRPGVDWNSSLQGHGAHVVEKLLATGSSPGAADEGRSGSEAEPTLPRADGGAPNDADAALPGAGATD